MNASVETPKYDDDAVEVTKFEEGILSIYPWHCWFAWHPIWMPSEGWVWLKVVERRFSTMSRFNGDNTIVRSFRRARSAGIEVKEVTE